MALLAGPGKRAGLQPWRAFILGFFLLMTYTRPRRRTTRQFLSRALAVRRLLRTLMTRGVPGDCGKEPPWIGTRSRYVKLAATPTRR
jgi:hypothetical protein